MIAGMHPEYALAGLLIGLLVGMTGMGGGSLMTPMLVQSARSAPGGRSRLGRRLSTRLRRQWAADEAAACQRIAQLVRRASGAQPCGGGQQGEKRDERAKPRPDRIRPRRVARARCGEEDETDQVGKPRRARVLERSLAEAGLEDLEVEQAGEAEAPPEGEADGELGGQHCEQPPGADRHRDERDEPDDRLIRPRRPGVDDLRVPIRIRDSLDRTLHFLKY
jgi:hypothetical protein